MTPSFQSYFNTSVIGFKDSCSSILSRDVAGSYFFFSIAFFTLN